MISSAAASVSGSLALGPGAQAAPADDAAVSTDFAALLGRTVASDGGSEAAAGKEGVTDSAALLKQAIGKQTRQAGGKKLPQDLPDPAEELTDSAKQADDTSGSVDGAPALPSVTTQIVLPGFVVPISMSLHQSSTPAATLPSTPANNSGLASPAAQQGTALSTTNSLAQAAAAQATRLPLPSATETALAAKAGKAVAFAQQSEVQASTAPNPAAQGTASAAISLSAKPDGTVAESAATAQAAPAATLLPGSPTRADEVRVTIASTVQPAATPTSTSAQLASSVQGASQVIGQGTDKAAAAAKSAAPKAQQSAATASTDAATPNQAAIQAAANGSHTNAPAAPRGNTAAQEATTAATDPRSAQAKAASSDNSGVPAQAATAAISQPLFGLQDGQSLSQSATPVASAPSIGGVGQTGHDFAALVDRLVEARDAASPASVHAAVTHSEFGQVSLRFDQDANGLSVAMSSADPEFARAVQASSAQSQMSGDNANDRGSGAPRQETSGQQQAGSPSNQSQAQSSASGRGDRNSPSQTDNRTGPSSGRPTQDAETADTRGGIYA